VGQRSQASFREQYPGEEDWAAKVAQQRAIDSSLRPKVNRAEIQLSSERGNVVPKKQLIENRRNEELTTLQGSYLQQIPLVQSPQELMEILGTPGSAIADATGLHLLPVHLRAQPLDLLARQLMTMPNRNAGLSTIAYSGAFSALAEAANEIPVTIRHADSIEVQRINHSRFVLPSIARSVETPDQFMEILGTAGANGGEPTGIQSLPVRSRVPTLGALSLRIHRMQGESVPRAELTRQLLAAIDQIPVATRNRNPELVSIERIATSSLSSPNRPTRDPADLVLEGVASPVLIAGFYNIDLNTLNAQVASRISSAGANAN
jgi:hypothetical protein